METEFIEHLENSGIQDADGLANFLSSFLENPAMFFEMNDSERNEIEGRMDRAIEVLLNGSN